MRHCHIVAHRGASYDAPENTLEAFRLAWRSGVSVVEGDFRLTSDGCIVCFHDEKTGRIGGGSLDIASSKLEDLRKLDVGAWKGAAWAGAKIPTIEEILEEMPPGNMLLVEIKCGVEILDVIARMSFDVSRIAIMSFSENVIAGAKKMMPEVEAFWLTRCRKSILGHGIDPEIEKILYILDETGADGLGCKAHEVVDESFISALHQHGKKVNVWTVDDPVEAKLYIDAGADYLTTNRPMYINKSVYSL